MYTVVDIVQGTNDEELSDLIKKQFNDELSSLAFDLNNYLKSNKLRVGEVENITNFIIRVPVEIAVLFIDRSSRNSGIILNKHFRKKVTKHLDRFKRIF